MQAHRDISRAAKGFFVRIDVVSSRDYPARYRVRLLTSMIVCFPKRHSARGSDMVSPVALLNLRRPPTNSHMTDISLPVV